MAASALVAMQLFVRDPDGCTHALAASPECDVAALKEQLAALVGVPAAEQQLVHAGQALDDAASLLAAGLADESTVFLSAGLDGGAKKRKKKTYTKPKKIKHKRKKVKLAVLKFYKVDSNDKVSRLRRECPHEMCGPGVFMAMHFNRYYCGKCHLTYLIKKGE
eukprot:TRINITY_DN627_c0_g2_i9.p2 TRINITY_DN627_c0_g2~~TRINITY_DN627_c0_g2_i9.p2  ORF type:complete len:163 (-),score=60.79 TRINITY_DN627_c0_g2_i9:84-572(-)